MAIAVLYKTDYKQVTPWRLICRVMHMLHLASLNNANTFTNVLDRFVYLCSGELVCVYDRRLYMFYFLTIKQSSPDEVNS